MLAKGILLVLMIMAIAGCGGGEMTPAVGKPVDAVITFEKEEIMSESLEGSEKVQVNINCKGRDLFIENCIIPVVEISWGGWSYTKPLNWNVRANSSASYELAFITDSDRTLEPLSYVREVNPSTSATDWTIYSEVLSVPEAKQIGKAMKACSMKTTYTPPTCTFDKEGKQICTCSKGVLQGERCVFSEEVCEVSKTYSGNIANYLQGTVRVTDGSQNLTEAEVMGILSGAGSGIVNNGNISVAFSGSPPEGALILAMYLKHIEKLKSISRGGMKLVYGNLKLEQEEGTNFLVDGNKNVYAEIFGSSLVFYKPIGFQGAPLVAYYGGEPYNAYGGEVIGEGDGVKTIFNLRTKYQNVKSDTLKVFTATGPGKIILFNKFTGEMTVKFDTPPAVGEKIKASYVLFKVDIPIKLKFKTNGGDVERVIYYQNRNNA